MIEKLDSLYHYTSIPACYSILKSKSIWATDYRFLNDNLELTRAINEFVSKCPDKTRAAMKYALGWHARAYFHCVLSFSDSPTVLSQWRTYASNASGVAIGFHKWWLTDSMKLNLHRCIYGAADEYIEGLILKHSELIDLANSKIKEMKSYNGFLEWSDEYGKPFESLINELLVLKNNAFKEEGEIRVIFTLTRDEIKFRCNETIITPYKELSFWNHEEDGDLIAHRPLSEIYLGPRCDTRNEFSLRELGHGVNISKYNCGYI